MDRRTGSAFLIALLLITIIGSAYAGVTLRVTDMQGYELEQVAAGQPFTVDVVVADLGSNLSAPVIRGDSRITLQYRGQQFSTTNDNTTAKFTYQGIINEPGEYVLGPATITHGGQSTDSNVLYIVVSTTPKTVGKQRQKEREEVLCTLSIDNDRIFVGECTTATLTFYYVDDTVSLKNVMPPALDGFNARGDINKYVQGQEKIKGTLYNFVRWNWQLCPVKAGTLTIPAYGAEYEKTVTMNNNRFGLELFFMGRNERMRIYSNALNIHVDPLPPYNGVVTAVGSFNHVKAMIEPSVAQEGEALVLTLEFEGIGDLDAIKVPELHGMPDALKYYDSKHYSVENKNTVPKKRFEYIVQGMRAGTWQIPAQEFVIFDVIKKTYKMFRTKPLTVTITPHATMQKTNVDDAKGSMIENQTDDLISDELSPLDETGLWYNKSQRAPIPLWIFLLLSMVPCFYGLFIVIQRVMQRRAALHEPTVRAKKAFSIAKNALQKAQQQNDVTHIYPIFIQLLADRTRVKPKEVTQDFIEHQLEKAGVSGLDRTQWHTFFMQAAEATYGRKTTDVQNLFTQAERWINKLEGIL